MKLTRQGILSLDIKQTNRRWKTPHPIILNEEDMKARELPDGKRGMRFQEDSEEELDLND